jgi:hypothetical protein
MSRVKRMTKPRQVRRPTRQRPWQAPVLAQGPYQYETVMRPLQEALAPYRDVWGDVPMVTTILGDEAVILQIADLEFRVTGWRRA